MQTMTTAHGTINVEPTVHAAGYVAYQVKAYRLDGTECFWTAGVPDHQLVAVTAAAQRRLAA